MDKILKLILSCAFVIGLSVHGPIADAQRGTAFDARFKIAEGADLRILDDNIWDYSKDTIPPKWKAIGEDPRDFKRAPLFARLIKDYLPDVFAFQEYSDHMHKEFYHLCGIMAMSLLGNRKGIGTTRRSSITARPLSYCT